LRRGLIVVEEWEVAEFGAILCFINGLNGCGEAGPSLSRCHNNSDCSTAEMIRCRCGIVGTKRFDSDARVDVMVIVAVEDWRQGHIVLEECTPEGFVEEDAESTVGRHVVG
jgi:hypothetical protein